MVDYKAIGRRIKKYRKENDMTQAALSERLNVAENYVSQIECGSTKVSLSRLYEIADILHIDVAVLVSDGTKFSDFNFTSDIDEVVKNWTPDGRSILYEVVNLLDGKMKSN